MKGSLASEVNPLEKSTGFRNKPHNIGAQQEFAGIYPILRTNSTHRKVKGHVYCNIICTGVPLSYYMTAKHEKIVQHVSCAM